MAIDMQQAPQTPSTTGEAPRDTSVLDEAAVQQVVEIIHLLGSAKDAMSDEMVARIANTASEGLTLLDRLTRNQGLMRLLKVLDGPDCQHLLTSMADALAETSRDMASSPPASGGVSGMWHLAREPGTQEGVRMLSRFGQHLSDRMRASDRRGGD